MGKLTDWASRAISSEPLTSLSIGELSADIFQPSRRSLSLENPQTPLSAPADWLFETLSGGFGLDGQLWVNERTAMQLTTVWACVRAISQDCSTVPLPLFYVPDVDGNRKPADNRIEHSLLNRKPNPHMTAAVFRQTMIANKLLWGNAYAEIEYNGAGKIVALWPLYPQFVRMEMLPNKTLRYIVNNPTTGENRAILSDDMIHLKDVSVDGYCGLYTIRHLKEAVGLGLALQNFGLYYFLNGSRPGGVLETPGTLTPEAQDRLRSSWQAMHRGPRNTNNVAILEQGLKFAPIGVNNDNAQYAELRGVQAIEICRMFRMPPHKIGIIEKTSTGVQEQQALEYVTDCLRPHWVEVEQELNVKMFPSGGFEYEHDEEALLRGDFASQQEGFGKGRSGGWLSANDVRRKMKLNKIGPEGDIYLSPQNMVPADKAAAVADKLIESGKTPVGKEPTPTNGMPQGAPDGRSLSDEEIKKFTADLMTDAVGRSLNYDQNAQLPKMISRAFSGVFGAMARMLGREDADVIARQCAESVHERRAEWDGMTKDQIVAKEYELAFAAMKETINVA
jgi:HK97 family phage portal protein